MCPRFYRTGRWVIPHHDALTGPDSVHPAAYVGATDPALVPANYVGALKWWLDTSGAAPVLKYRDPTNTSWVPITVSDHGALTGLGDDDHPQYLKLALADAKGDLLVATGPDAVGRLTLGTNGRVLAADNTTTEGITWIDLPAALTNPLTAAEDLFVGGAAGVPDRLAVGANGQVLGVVAGALAWVPAAAAVAFTLGDGTNAITASEPDQWLEVPFACVVVSWRLLADAAGSVVVDLWRDTYANAPPTVADTITAAAKPTLTGAVKAESTTLTGWSAALAPGDWLRVHVDAATTVKRVVLSLGLRKT